MPYRTVPDSFGGFVMKLPSIKQILAIYFNASLLIAVPAIIMIDLARIFPPDVIGETSTTRVLAPNPFTFLLVLLYPVEALIVMLRPRLLLFPFNDAKPVDKTEAAMDDKAYF